MKKENNNLLYELHESDFIDFAIKNDMLIFRVAINCGVAEELGIESDFAEKFYIYDIICHKYSLFESDYTENMDLFLKEILCFKQIENKYLFSIDLNFLDSVDFMFDCESIEWTPIELLTVDELYEIEENDYKIK